MSNLNKQSILITGCSSGIGLAVAQDLQKLGYQVFATCRKPEDVAKIKNLGIRHAYQLDVTDTNSINQALEAILTLSNGRLDALFNNAGFGLPGAVEDLTKQALNYQFDSNVFGVLELTNKVIPIMREQGSGKIIITSSMLGFVSLRYRGAYVASKFALEGLFDTLRLELRKTPISVSIIQPGPLTSKFRNTAYQNFFKFIDPFNSAHAQQYKRMLRRVFPELDVNNLDEKDIIRLKELAFKDHSDSNYKTTPFELSANVVTKTLIKILESKNPRARYSITLPTYLFRFLSRVLPTVLLDKILYTITKSETD